MDLQDEDFQVDLRTLQLELPGFNPEDFPDLVESQRSEPDTPLEDGPNRIHPVDLPLPQTTPATPAAKLQTPEYPDLPDLASFEAINDVNIQTCLEMSREGIITPRPGVNCIHEPVWILVPDFLENHEDDPENGTEDQHPLLKNIPDYDTVTYDIEIDPANESVQEKSPFAGRDFNLAAALFTTT
jgi:hypothetical protein